MWKQIYAENLDERTPIQCINHFYVNVEKDEQKLETLCDFYKTLANTQTQSIIFVNTRCKVKWLTENLRSRDYTVSSTHEDMDENTKEYIMREFRSGSSRVLITTNLLPHGIDDVQQVSLVINFDLPTHFDLQTQLESYLHRIERSGMFGRQGVVVNFVSLGDESLMFGVQKFYSVNVKEQKKGYLFSKFLI